MATRHAKFVGKVAQRFLYVSVQRKGRGVAQTQRGSMKQDLQIRSRDVRSPIAASSISRLIDESAAARQCRRRTFTVGNIAVSDGTYLTETMFPTSSICTPANTSLARAAASAASLNLSLCLRTMASAVSSGVP